MDFDYPLKEKNIRIPIRQDSEKYYIESILTIPKDSKGLVIFVHGSGSGRHSQRNQYVSKVLNKDGVSTLLLDFLQKQKRKLMI